MNLPETFDNLIEDANKIGLYKKLIAQLNKDFSLANIDLDFDEDYGYDGEHDNDDQYNGSGEVKFLSPVRRLSTAMKIGFQKATGSPTKNNNNSNFDHNGEEYDYDDDDDDERIARSEDGEDMDNTLLLLCKELELIGDGDDE